MHSRRFNLIAPTLAVIALSVLALSTSRLQAADVLVADRLSNSVYRYSQTGTLLNTVVTDNANINQATGLSLSPDLQHLYVSSFNNARVMRYDYNAATGTATNGVIFADGSDGLANPSQILFSDDSQTIYVSNLGGTGVARFNLDGTLAGAPVAFPAPINAEHFQFSGLALHPNGDLLVGDFQSFPSGTHGAIGRVDPPAADLSYFVNPSTSLNGASGLLVHDNYLYVTGMFAGTIRRFNLSDGSADSTFGVAGLAFPQGLMLAPDGNGFIAGILGFANGLGHMAHYDFNGALIGDGVFATPGGGGFTEPTAFVTVPNQAVEPIPGDFNGDQLVNAADLGIWRVNFGNSSGSATVAMGDADGNGRIDGADFLVWQRHFTPAAAAPLSQAVPEPHALVLVSLAGLGLRRFIRRRERVRLQRSHGSRRALVG
ncbi:SMP-30/gluconolactonase/LRE family protein [Lacipirellula sp.]|uniref:SMP-30/gluconolactonase/LRE family protein n=1 Tax=Lacipirellula sp. TaxID=2691419 RepID=UPI003D152ECD